MSRADAPPVLRFRGLGESPLECTTARPATNSQRQTDQVIVRAATSGDESSIAEVHVAAWQRAYRGIMPASYLDGLSVPNRTDLWRAIIAELNPPAVNALVAVEDSTILGFVHHCSSRDPEATSAVGEISAIYVHPDQWGEGIGSQLLHGALDSLQMAGFSSATLWVLALNARARRFYESKGWRADGATRSEVRGSFTLDELRYSTRLSG